VYVCLVPRVTLLLERYVVSYVAHAGAPCCLRYAICEHAPPDPQAPATYASPDPMARPRARPREVGSVA
jgi:hypothetical protein